MVYKLLIGKDGIQVNSNARFIFDMDSEVKLFLIKIKVEAGISFSISTFRWIFESRVEPIKQGTWLLWTKK